MATFEREQQPWLTWKEVRIQCTLAGPLILGNLLSFLLPMVCVIFVGHTGELQLSVLNGGRTKFWSSFLGFCPTQSYKPESFQYGAVSTRVSNELGAGNPQAARGAVNVARILALGEALVLVVLLLLVRNVWGMIYSSDTEVVDGVASFIPFFATSSAFDALQAVLSGVLRGAGWQQVGAYLNLGSFYIAGLPTGCVLAFVAPLEGKGLWLGLIVGTFAQFVAYAIFIQFMDWKEEAKRAAARVGDSSSAIQPLLITDS